MIRPGVEHHDIGVRAFADAALVLHGRHPAFEPLRGHERHLAERLHEG